MHLDRLAADTELAQALMWAQYEGPAWRKFREVLARYGVAVIQKWILSGRIFRECARKGFGGIRRRRPHDDEALGMAGETVARAMVFFREKVLIPGAWDPTRGASLRTYFIGACVLHFPNVYDLLQGDEHPEHILVNDRDVGEQVGAVQGSVAGFQPDKYIEALQAFDALPDATTRRMVLCRAAGHTDREVAELLGTTTKAVEMRLYHLHRRDR